MIKNIILCAAAAAIAVISPGDAKAEYPERPITLVIPFGPGGGGDYIGRSIIDKLGEVLGQPVVIENHPGASTMVGTARVARAAPDGYTLLLNQANFTTNPALQSNIPYDTVGDFKPIARIVAYPMVLAVRGDLPVGSIEELVEFGKAQPEGLTNAMSGVGAGNHLAIELFSKITGVPFRHIPFSGVGAVMAAVAGGHVDVAIAGITQIEPFLADGRMKVLGSTGLETMNTQPPIPAIAAQGVEGFEYTLWWGLVAPKGTPDAIVEKIHEALKVTLQDASVLERFAGIHGHVALQGPDEFGEFILADIAFWDDIIKAAGITPQ